MPTELRKAIDDDGNEVELSKECESQIVETADKGQSGMFDPTLHAYVKSCRNNSTIGSLEMTGLFPFNHMDT